MLTIGKSIKTSGNLANINTSDIFSELIQAAGMGCERFSSDIIYDINDITYAINNGDNEVFYIGIRTDGVDGTSFMRVRLDKRNAEYSPNRYIKIYRIAVATDGENMTVLCERISEYEATQALVK